MDAHPHRADAARLKVELAEVFTGHGAAYRALHDLLPVQHRAMRAALEFLPPPQSPEPESVAAFWLRVACLDIHQCPRCKAGRMIVIGPIPVPGARAPPPLPS